MSATPMRALSEEELLRIMEHAVESREYGKLDFMANFFRTGTVSRLMVESQVRFVWINDWFPIKDLTYAIAVDTERKRVLVVFRGAITFQDWSQAIDAKLRQVQNPIQEDFEGKSETIGIHSGFYQYLFRPRKDTGTKKYDEVANMAHKYGLERIGEDYSLAVVGHSLGAALSTVFSFFASTDERFTRNGPIQVFTFGSPYVGGHTFADSFMHQEASGKLMYARFYNNNDFVAHAPANFGITKVRSA
jgi:predicted lipase